MTATLSLYRGDRAVHAKIGTRMSAEMPDPRCPADSEDAGAIMVPGIVTEVGAYWSHQPSGQSGRYLTVEPVSPDWADEFLARIERQEIENERQLRDDIRHS